KGVPSVAHALRGLRVCHPLYLLSSAWYADGMAPVGRQQLGNRRRDRYVGRLARSQTEGIRHQLGTCLLHIIPDTRKAGRVLDAEVVNTHRPEEVLRMKQLRIGVWDGAKQPALALIDLVASQLIGVHDELSKLIRRSQSALAGNARIIGATDAVGEIQV